MIRNSIQWGRNRTLNVRDVEDDVSMSIDTVVCVYFPDRHSGNRRIIIFDGGIYYLEFGALICLLYTRDSFRYYAKITSVF
jgi:hypothetical protein